MMFNQYPYLNVNDFNLDYILSQIKVMMNEVTNFVSINAIKYADPIQWDITRQYEKNTVVIDPVTGTAYITVAPVPAGVALTRPEYWTVVFDLGSFVTRAAQNFTSRYEQETTLTATFPTNTGEWLIWGDVLYKAKTNIIAGDTYVVDSNIEHFTMEDLYNAYLNTIANILAIIGDLQDLTTSDTSSIVNAINSVLSDLNMTIGDLANLNTTDKSDVVNAINEVLADVGQEATNRTNADNDIMARIDDFKIVNARDYGVVGDGVTDDTAALRAWLQAVRNNCIERSSILIGYVYAYLPAGVYYITGKLDLSTYFETGGKSFEYITFDMMGASFKVDSNFEDSLIFNCAPAGNSQFINCTFKIGDINASNLVATCMRMYNVNDCRIDINKCINAVTACLQLDQSSAQTNKIGIFNNLFNIISLGYAQYGLLLVSDPNDSLYAIQGNIFNATHIFNCVEGVNIDLVGMAYSNLNQFHFGAVEYCTSAGIIDNAGNNMFFINSCNGNAADFFLGVGARPDYVVGSFAGAVNLRNIPSRFTNLAAPTGELATQPPLAGVGIEYINPNLQTVQVRVHGDTLSAIYINARPFITNANAHIDSVVILRPADKISLIYDPTDTTVGWEWFGL